MTLVEYSINCDMFYLKLKYIIHRKNKSPTLSEISFVQYNLSALFI